MFLPLVGVVRPESGGLLGFVATSFRPSARNEPTDIASLLPISPVSGFSFVPIPVGKLLPPSPPSLISSHFLLPSTFNPRSLRDPTLRASRRRSEIGIQRGRGTTRVGAGSSLLPIRRVISPGAEEIPFMPPGAGSWGRRRSKITRQTPCFPGTSKDQRDAASSSPAPIDSINCFLGGTGWDRRAKNLTT